MVVTLMMVNGDGEADDAGRRSERQAQERKNRKKKGKGKEKKGGKGTIKDDNKKGVWGVGEGAEKTKEMEGVQRVIPKKWKKVVVIMAVTTVTMNGCDNDDDYEGDAHEAQ